MADTDNIVHPYCELIETILISFACFKQRFKVQITTLDHAVRYHSASNHPLQVCTRVHICKFGTNNVCNAVFLSIAAYWLQFSLPQTVNRSPPTIVTRKGKGKHACGLLLSFLFSLSSAHNTLDAHSIPSPSLHAAVSCCYNFVLQLFCCPISVILNPYEGMICVGSHKNLILQQNRNVLDIYPQDL